MGKKSKNRSLGRGLGAILGEVSEAYEKELRQEAEESGRLVEIPLDAIRSNPYQPRTRFDEEAIRELSESIRRHGLLQPIVVIEEEDGYMLIAGERRVRASKMAGLDQIRAIVAEIDESRFRELALIENIQRESLNPVELARSYKELIEEYGISHEELAGIIHKSRAQITNTLRLLNLSEYVLEKIASGQISQGHGKVMVGLDEEDQKIVCDTVLGRKLSVRETEQLVSNMKSESKAGREAKNRKKEREGIDLSDYHDVITRHVPFRVRVKKRHVEIDFETKEELTRFISKLSQEE